MNPHEQQIIFFDGVCNLCNTFVDFVIRRDHQTLFAFAPLQGATAQAKLPAVYRERMDTFVLWRQDQIAIRSQGVLQILTQLGGAWPILRVFFLIPNGLRDAIYQFMARHRYRLLGKKETCRVPTAAERARFLP